MAALDGWELWRPQHQSGKDQEGSALECWTLDLKKIWLVGDAYRAMGIRMYRSHWSGEGEARILTQVVGWGHSKAEALLRACPTRSTH